MTKDDERVRQIVGLLMVASLMLCLIVPMSGAGSGGMELAIFCCFVLAMVMPLFALARKASPSWTTPTACSAPVVSIAPSLARTPNPVILTSLRN